MHHPEWVCLSLRARLSLSACLNRLVHLVGKSHYWSMAYMEDIYDAAPSKDQASTDYQAFLALTADLGLRLSSEKYQPTSTRMEWLVFVFDTVGMMLPDGSDAW